MKSYIIRIYRDEQDKRGQLLGTIERPGAAKKLAFTNRDELWDILYPASEKRDDLKEWETQKK